MATVSTGQFFIIDVNDGSSLYTAAIYQQAISQPATPTGGTYNYASLTLTAPTNWSSTLPSATTTPTWVCYYTFSTTDRTATITAATWSVPTIYSQKGDPGVTAKTLSVISDRQNITYDSSGNINPSVQTTTFTAQKQNTTATVTWTMTKADGTALTASTYLSATTGDTVTMTAANFNTARGTTQGVIVTGSITDGSTITDSISVVKSADGAAAIVGVLTNEATTLAAGSTGTVSNFTPASGNFNVYSGTSDVTASSTFTVYSQTGCTVAITTAGAYSVSAMSSDSASAVLQAVYNSVTIRKTLSLAKSKAGINAITLLLTADRQTIVYDSSGNPSPATQTTTFTAQKQNTTATVNWTMTKLDGTTLTPSSYLSAVTGDSVTMTETNFATARGTTNGVIVKASLTDGSVSVNDTVTIVKIAPIAGSTGERGSKSFYATTTATSWAAAQDTEANTAVTSAGYTKVVGDQVTLYNNGATKWTMTKRWDGSTWANIGTVIDGSLIVSGSVTSSAIDTRNLSIKDGSGNVLFSSGVNLDFSLVGGTTKPADNANKTFIDTNGAIQGVSSGAGTAIQNSLLDTLTFGTTNVTASGNTITKTGGSDGTWDAQGYSKESYTLGAYCSFSSAVNNTAVAAGLNTDPLTNSGYNSIDFAFLLSNNGSLFIYELNSFVLVNDTYAAGDIFSITYDGSKVRYYQNGVVKRTATVTITDPLYFDSSIMTMNASISKIKFGPMTSNAWSQIGGTNKPADNATKNNVYQQGSEPTSGMGVNDIWYKTGVSPAELYTYSGTAWVLSSTVGATSSQITNISSATTTANSAATTANAASTAAADRLSKSAVNAINSGCALTIGSINVAADGSRSSGTGIIISNYGILGYNGSGVNTFNISSGGDSQFKGSLLIGSSPAVSDKTMTGTGGIINPSDGSFAFGNASNNISFNGTTLTINGDVVATGNIKANSVTASKVPATGLFKIYTSILTTGTVTGIVDNQSVIIPTFIGTVTPPPNGKQIGVYSPIIVTGTIYSDQGGARTLTIKLQYSADNTTWYEGNVITKLYVGTAISLTMGQSFSFVDSYAPWGVVSNRTQNSYVRIIVTWSTTSSTVHWSMDVSMTLIDNYV